MAWRGVAWHEQAALMQAAAEEERRRAQAAAEEERLRAEESERRQVERQEQDFLFREEVRKQTELELLDRKEKMMDREVELVRQLKSTVKE